MTLLERLRLYHAALATLALAAYMTGELGLIRAWLGYTVAVVIVLRIMWGLFGPRQIGISRLMPTLSEITQIRWFNHPAISKILLSGIIVNLLLVTATGIAIDRFSSLARAPWIEASVVSEPGEAEHGALLNRRKAPALPAIMGTKFEREDDDHKREGWLGELHEATANLLLVSTRPVHVVSTQSFPRKPVMLCKEGFSRGNFNCEISSQVT